MPTYYGWPRSSPYAEDEYWSIEGGTVTFHDREGETESGYTSASGVCSQRDGHGKSPERITRERVEEIRKGWGSR